MYGIEREKGPEIVPFGRVLSYMMAFLSVLSSAMGICIADLYPQIRINRSAISRARP
jgi:hypothetical protein